MQKNVGPSNVITLIAILQLLVLLFFVVPVQGQQWWSAPADLGGVALDSGPSAVAGGQHKIDVFYRGPNAHLWTSSWDGGQWWSAPADLGGVALTSDPVAITGGSHRVDVFYRGPNNHLWTSWWPDKLGGQSWSAPTDLGGEAISSAPAAAAGGSHTIDVFYRGPNNHLWTSWWPDKPGSQWWSAQNDLGGQPLTSAPAAVAGGRHRLDVFYRGPNNHLWTSWWPDKPDSQWWSGAADLGGEPLSSAPSAIANGRHNIDVFYSGPNSHLWTSWWPDNPGGQWWSAANDLGVAISSVPGAAVAGKDQLDVFYRGPNNHLWTSWWPDKPWLDAQTGQPSPHAAPYDLVTQIFDPDNGLPLNPMLGSQTWPSPQLADASLCGGGDPWKTPCTTQTTWIDNNPVKCLPNAPLSPGPLGGHANWGLATYEGRIYFADHSCSICDDDYSFVLYRDDLAGMTQVDLRKKEYLHSEFNSDQTINNFHTWYWDKLHQAVDSDGGFGGVSHGSWPKTSPLFDGKEAIVMGLYGLDCAHECGAELHPVYAFAVHLSDDKELNDDTWAVFVRNWGDEGYCSADQERIDPDHPFQFSFRFKKPGAAAVDLIPGDSSDPQGQHTTSIDFGFASPQAGWSTPVIVPSEGAVMTFFLPPSSQGNWTNAMLHLKWKLGLQASALVPYRKQPWKMSAPLTNFVARNTSVETEVPEERLGQVIAKMTPEERTALEKSLPAQPPRPKAVKLSARPVPPRAPAGRVTKPVVKLVPDAARQQRELQVQEALKKTTPPQ